MPKGEEGQVWLSDLSAVILGGGEGKGWVCEGKGVLRHVGFDAVASSVVNPKFRQKERPGKKKKGEAWKQRSGRHGDRAGIVGRQGRCGKDVDVLC